MDFFYYYLYIFNLIFYIDRGVLYSLLPQLILDFHMSKFQQGFLLSTFMIGFSLSSLIFSYISKKFNKILLLCFGNFIFILSSLGLFLITDYFDNYKTLTNLFILRSLSGVGEGAYMALIPTLLNEVYGIERGNLKISILYSSINIGFSIGIFIGGFFSNWKYIYLSISIAMTIFSIIIFKFRYIPRDYYDNETNEFNKFKKIIKNKDWWISLMCMASINFTVTSFSSWIPTLYKKNFTPQYKYKNIISILSVSFILTSIFGSWITNNIVNRIVKQYHYHMYNLYNYCFIINLFLVCVCYLTLYFNQNIYLTFIFLILVLFAYSLIMIPNSLIGIITIPIESRCYSNSINMLLIHILGDIPAPIICSYIWSKTNNLVISLKFCIIPILISIIFYFTIISLINYTNNKKRRVLLNESLLVN